MYVEKIITFDKHDKEADLLVSDGVNKVMCYAYPIERVQINQEINRLYGFECTNIKRANKNECEINKLQEYYAYSLVGKVVVKKDNLVRVGELDIYLDDSIPIDIQENEFVVFDVTRLDMQ